MTAIKPLQVKLEKLRAQANQFAMQLNAIQVEIVKTEGVIEYLLASEGKAYEPDTD